MDFENDIIKASLNGESIAINLIIPAPKLSRNLTPALSRRNKEMIEESDTKMTRMKLMKVL